MRETSRPSASACVERLVASKSLLANVACQTVGGQHGLWPRRVATGDVLKQCASHELDNTRRAWRFVKRNICHVHFCSGDSLGNVTLRYSAL